MQVSEKRKVDVKFVGNRAVGEDLRDQLTIFTTGAYDEIELQESAKALQRYYQQRGYFEAKPSPPLEPAASRRRQPTSRR